MVDGADNAASLDAAESHRPAHSLRLDGRDLRLLCRQRRPRHARTHRRRRGQGDLHPSKQYPPADPDELAARYVEQYGKMAQVAKTLEEALSIANRAVTKEDLICITGSFYLVGEAKKYFASKPAQ